MCSCNGSANGLPMIVVYHFIAFEVAPSWCVSVRAASDRRDAGDWSGHRQHDVSSEAAGTRQEGAASRGVAIHRTIDASRQSVPQSYYIV